MRSYEILSGVKVTNDRCLILDDGPTAVFGDLHLGYESALEEEGMYIPRMNTDSIRDAINGILSEYEPKRVVLLGDIKHDFKRSRREAREEVKRIIGMLMEASEVIVIKGNHDNFLQNILSDMGLMAVDYVNMAGFRMEHGHADSGARPVIIGHEHPSVRIPGAMSGGMKMHCFVHQKEDGVIVLPPFSPFSSGNDLVLDGKCIMAPALSNSNYPEADIYGVSEVGIMKLGKLKDVMDISI
ncbi:MAG: metallophosphoesterase [Candidatus Methanoplasma sp.]|jgi:putative SbcD/Mre11-related phosphoesterase|nr:metallophosphoesterase [Candidatus Methanoplasma sp.]